MLATRGVRASRSWLVRGDRVAPCGQNPYMSDRYGVVGHPVGHSLSPFIHGLFSRDTGQAMSYRPYDFTPEQFAAPIGDFFTPGGRRPNVTAPHKISAPQGASQLTTLATHA